LRTGGVIVVEGALLERDVRRIDRTQFSLKH